MLGKEHNGVRQSQENGNGLLSAAPYIQGLTSVAQHHETPKQAGFRLPKKAILDQAQSTCRADRWSACGTGATSKPAAQAPLGLAAQRRSSFLNEWRSHLSATLAPKDVGGGLLLCYTCLYRAREALPGPISSGC